MKGRSSLFALAVLTLALACENSQMPTGLRVPADASKIINDGANDGNPDFFFLPPLVQPLGSTTPGFEPNEFNSALQPSLTVEICRLKPEKLDKQKLPTAATPCYKNGPRDMFPAGTVKLVDGIPSGTGWWTGLDLPDDGFYYVEWDTQEAHLNAQKFYRVKVFIDGSSVPLGFVDIDPLKRLRELRTSRVGKVVQVPNGDLLPIPFRVENHALCGGATLCTSETVDNDGGSVTVDGGGGAAIAGASFREGWLPVGPGRPTSVVVTIAEVPSGENEDGSRTRTTPCHIGLPFQQFDKCFQFATIPPLADITPDVQFADTVIVAVCYVLENSPGDERREFAELYASGPGEPPHALEEVNDIGRGILSEDARDCTPSEGEPFALESSNPLTRLASAGWRKFRGGLGQLFGVKTAYAVDGGLGGIVKGFSNIGPALTAEIEAYPHANPEPDTTRLTLVGGTATARVTIVGSHSHDPADEGFHAPAGINGVPVTFTVVGAGSTLDDGEVDGLHEATVMTTTFHDEGFDDGVASVVWTPPTIPNTYILKATGPTADTVTFMVTVPSLPNPVLSFTGSEPVAVGNVSMRRYNLSVTNYQAYPATMFVIHSGEPLCPGSDGDSSRTYAEIYGVGSLGRFNTICNFEGPAGLQSISFLYPAGPPPAAVYVKLTDRMTGATYTSNTVSLLPQ